ncbi:hypothetical protein TNCV_3550491 [Trichonephila clavipes]|nr:hypothetical protein TNCV_3550491 [Trichonephila clavipes]
MESRCQAGSWPGSNGGGLMVTSGPKMVSRLWDQFQTSGTITRKVSHGHDRTSASSKERYLDLSAQLHRRTTALQFAWDLAAVSRRRISMQTLCSRLAETGL